MKNLIQGMGKGTIDPQVAEYLYNDPKSTTEKLSLADLQKRVPTLSWASDGHPLPFAELDARLQKEFPSSTAASRSAIAALIQRADEKWAGGDADKALSQKELLTPGVILGLVERYDFSKGLPARFNAAPAAIEILNRKVNQQLFGRYAINDFAKLPAGDLQLEWAQLLLRKQLIEKQFAGLKGSEAADSDLPAVLGVWGYKVEGDDATEAWTKIAHVYDQRPVFFGDGDGKLGALEAINLLTDASFAQAVVHAFDDAPSAALADKHAEQVTLLAGLYPTIGSSLLLDASGKPEDAFWSTLGDAKSGPTQALLALDVADLEETVFSHFDANHDKKLQKEEAQAALKALGMKNSSAIEMLYLGVPDLEPAEFFTRILNQVTYGSLDLGSSGPAPAKPAPQGVTGPTGSAPAKPAPVNPTPAPAPAQPGAQGSTGSTGAVAAPALADPGTATTTPPPASAKPVARKAKKKTPQK
jgi:hypothetical protein